MLRYIARRVVTSIGLLWLSSMIIFCLMRIIPAAPTITKLGGAIQGVDPRALRALRHQLALDQFDPRAVHHWISAIFHGNFGEVVLQPVPGHDPDRRSCPAPALELALVAFLFAIDLPSPFRPRPSA